MRNKTKLEPKVSSKLKLKGIYLYAGIGIAAACIGVCFFVYLNVGNTRDVKAAGIPVIINGYARVTDISGDTLRVQTSSVSEVAGTGTFTAGERAILIQMQDDVIGTTGDNVNFGDIGSILSAGLYEVITISAVTRNGGGNLRTVVFSGSLTNSYNIGGRSRVLIVTFPTLNDGSGNYTTTSDITALAWDGNVGGIVAFNVNNTLTLLHDIYVDGTGFRGGAANIDNIDAVCDENTYRTSSGTNYADKGEGIYSSTNGRAAARGKIINGGGGGNIHNSGGGGGGNYSAGGDGGPGWEGGSPGYCSPSAGGLGGLALSSHISLNRVFMGGGGGSGEGNNDGATAGGAGGGIIFISAQTLYTDNSCSVSRISANGDNALDTGSPAGNDGASGGGAGGSVILDISNYNINASCPLNIQANGGNGGSVNDGATHGGGGGGGMGVIMLSVPVPIANVSTGTDPGVGGENSNSGGSSAAPGDGSVGAEEGVSDNSPIVLPVELKDFKGYSEDDYVHLSWTTLTEINNDYFDVEISRDGYQFINIGKVDGAGTTKEIRNYEFKHFNQFSGVCYYRLKQVDYDGKFEYSKIIFVDHTTDIENAILNVFPNPSSGKDVNIQIISKSDESIDLKIINSRGEISVLKTLQNSGSGNFNLTVNLGTLKNGVYTVLIQQGKTQLNKKLLIN